MYNEEYWKKSMSKRQPLSDEVDRLIMIAKGYLLEELIYESKCKYKDTIDLDDTDLLYFVKNAKRPYGNKNKEASICYNLGWDWKRDLENWQMPDWVIEEAKKVHEEVIETLKKERKEYLNKLRKEINKNLR